MGVTNPKAWPIGFIDTLMTPNTGMVLLIIDHKKAPNKACFFPHSKWLGYMQHSTHQCIIHWKLIMIQLWMFIHS
jgi:hypothetical protein